MNHLICGAVKQERLTLLLSLTKINSESVVMAIELHLVKGFPEQMACSHCEVKRGNFDRAMVKLNKVAGTVEQIKDMDRDTFKLSKAI